MLSGTTASGRKRSGACAAGTLAPRRAGPDPAAA
jgi:hypothetical protein